MKTEFRRLEGRRVVVNIPGGALRGVVDSADAGAVTLSEVAVMEPGSPWRDASGLALVPYGRVDWVQVVP